MKPFDFASQSLLIISSEQFITSGKLITSASPNTLGSLYNGCKSALPNTAPEVSKEVAGTHEGSMK